MPALKVPNGGKEGRRSFPQAWTHPFITLFPANYICHQRTLGRGPSSGVPCDPPAKTCWEGLTLCICSTSVPTFRLQISGLIPRESKLDTFHICRPGQV